MLKVQRRLGALDRHKKTRRRATGGSPENLTFHSVERRRVNGMTDECSL